MFLTRQLLAFCLCAMLAVSVYPTSSSAATTETTDVATLTKMVAALEAYLGRMRPATTTTPLPADTLRASIRNGVSWLTRAQEPNGHFRYEYAPFEDSYRHDDNIVRQAGSLFALGEILRETSGDPLSVRTTTERSIGYLNGLAKDGTVGTRTFRCITKSATSDQCSLGTSALALVGITAFASEFSHEARALQPFLEDYATYVLAMQKTNGGFRDQFTVGGTHLRENESAFSNGEAVLALVRYYEYHKDQEVKQAIDRAFAYLETEPLDGNLYLWIMAALRDMYALSPNDAYLTYADTFTKKRVAEGSRFADPTKNYCAYTEGLASAIELLQHDTDTYDTTAFERELNVRDRANLALQITERDAVRFITPKHVPTFGTLSDLERAQGGFLTGDSEPTERIDYTQHCIGSFLGTLRVQGKTL